MLRHVEAVSRLNTDMRHAGREGTEGWRFGSTYVDGAVLTKQVAFRPCTITLHFFKKISNILTV